MATELYDEVNDPTETVSLHDKAEHQQLLKELEKHLPPVGSSAPVPKQKAAASGNNTAPAKNNTAPANETRDARFDRLYPNKKQLTLEEYLTKQSDTEAAKQRFAKFDSNGDGIVSRDEFIASGKK